jgi:hypothetical protein
MRRITIVTVRERRRETIIVVTTIEGVKETTTGERGRIIVGMIGVVIMIVMVDGVTTRNVAESDLLHEKRLTKVTDEWFNHGRTETDVIVMTTTAVTVVVIATASTTVVAMLRMIPGIDETIAIVTIAAVAITTDGGAIEVEVAVGNAETVNGTDAAETAVRLPLRKVTTS